MTDQHARGLFLRSMPSPFLVTAALILLGLVIENSTNAYTQDVVLWIFTNIILAASLNLVSGFTGQFSLGHAGFMAVGAYLSAWCSFRPEFQALPDLLRFTLLPAIGGLGAAIAGYIVGLPSLRLRGDYLAIVTLGFGEIIRVTLLNTEAVGGARGLNRIPATEGWLEMGLSPYLAQFSIASFWTVVTITTLWRIVHSQKGRIFLSVREDEIAAEAMGVNVTQAKVRAFVISAFFAGVGGSLFAHSVKYLSPATFSFTKSVDIIIMIVLGGMGSFTGSVIAAIFITLVPEFVLRPLQEITKVDLRMVIYSLILILFMIMRPTGLLGTREWSDFAWVKKLMRAISQLLKRGSDGDSSSSTSPSGASR
ncbi:MAG TPA: branched-chain amino acid ABC transporter permease [Pseudobdellovibrionaceae bacterium]|nr:branched-chain amino acid ABC transporter permease [Pseudobdellovibrionaceae bacterium]